MTKTMLALIAAGALASAAVMTPAAIGHGKASSMTTEQNRKIITDFADLFYTKRDVRTAFERYVSPHYIQHSPRAADGRDAAIAMLVPLFGNKGAQFDVKRILVDGDFAVIHVHGRPIPNDPGVAVFDMYRLQDGKIVEHWDAVQPVPVSAPNAHPMF